MRAADSLRWMLLLDRPRRKLVADQPRVDVLDPFAGEPQPEDVPVDVEGRMLAFHERSVRKPGLRSTPDRLHNLTLKKIRILMYHDGDDNRTSRRLAC